jgi:anhydro-N-acetylmuramic acid kinase
MENNFSYFWPVSKDFFAVGLMSGTSLDGLDLALCRFAGKNNKYQYEILEAETLPYSGDWKRKLENAANSNAEDFFSLNSAYGNFIGRSVNAFLRGKKIKPQILASHGHTIFHQPPKGISVQLGSGAAIAAETGITTVCDFRALDVALGGQGAPLVPIGDELLFNEFSSCLNLGGIANISFSKKGKRIAFDICAVNMVINFLSEKLGKKMDEDGRIAAAGIVNKKLLLNLNSDKFYLQPDKKSIGREWVESNVLTKIQKANLSAEDSIATFTEHAAQQIANVVLQNKLKDVLITGGGAYNKFLVKRIHEISGAEIILPEKKIVEFKEALIFAFLGMLRVRNEVNTLRTVTGAGIDSCGGAVYFGGTPR